MKKKRCVIHIGMHKTGSSSIQRTLAGLRNVGADYEYLNLGNPNHSLFLSTIFKDRPHKHRLHVRDGKSMDQVEEIRKQYIEKFSAILGKTRARTVVISAEVLSVFAERELVEFKRFLDGYCDEFQVVGYVREPVSFLESDFQERVKAGRNFFNLGNIYPNYRERFEKFDALFGKGHVELVEFARSDLYGNDVVKDFCRRVGIPVCDGDIVRVNEGLSVQGVAVLYAHRKLSAAGRVSPLSRDEDALFVRPLKSISGGKLRFGDGVVAPVLSRHLKDREWMEARLGKRFHRVADDEPVVRSEEDLVKIAKGGVEAALQQLREGFLFVRGKRRRVLKCMRQVQKELMQRTTDQQQRV